MSHSKSNVVSRGARKLIGFTKERYKASFDLEQIYLKKQLIDSINAIPLAKVDDVLNQAFDYFEQENNPELFSSFFQVVASCFESQTIQYNQKEYDALFVIMPIFVWAPFYDIHFGKIPKSLMRPMEEAFKKIVLADDVKFQIQPTLLTHAHLPNQFKLVKKLFDKMCNATLSGKNFIYNFEEQAVPSVSVDIRFFIATVIAPKGQVFFKWQQEKNPNKIVLTRAKCIAQWKKLLKPVVQKFLPGCHFDLMLPNAFFKTLQNSRLLARFKLLIASFELIQDVLKIPLNDVAVIVTGFSYKPYSNDEVDQFRIGFYRKSDKRLFHGVIWDIFSMENTEVLQGGEKAVDMLNYFKTDGANQKCNLKDILEELHRLNFSFEDHLVERYSIEQEEPGEELFIGPDGEFTQIDYFEESGLLKTLH